MGLKPPLSYTDQIERLKKNGVEIPDHETALSILSEANYYRLTGYALQFSMTRGRFVCHVHHFTGTNFLLNLHDQLSSLNYQQFPR